MKSEKGQGIIEYGGVLLLIIAVIVALLMLAPQVRQALNAISAALQGVATELDRPLVEDTGYTAIPLTEHARRSHAGQAWNATSIAEAYDSGKCTPQEYYCAGQDYRVVWCEINPDKELGLVIGLTIQKIITGYMADTGYWSSQTCR